MHDGLVASDAWLRPVALALALAGLCLASGGCVYMLSTLPQVHGSGRPPSPSPWLGSASPSVIVLACWARCLRCMAQADRPRSCLGLALFASPPVTVHACWARCLRCVAQADRPRSCLGLASFASPPVTVHACWARCPRCMAQADRPRSCLGLALFASPPVTVHACWARCLRCVAQACRPRSRLGLPLPRRLGLGSASPPSCG